MIKLMILCYRNDYYGSEWTSFPLNGLIEWSQLQQENRSGMYTSE